MLKKNDIVYYEGHSIPTSIWLELFNKLNVSTESKEISDEDMEKGLY